MCSRYGKTISQREEATASAPPASECLTTPPGEKDGFPFRQKPIPGRFEELNKRVLRREELIYQIRVGKSVRALQIFGEDTGASFKLHFSLAGNKDAYHWQQHQRVAAPAAPV